MHGANQVPSITNWKEFVNSAPANRRQRMRELDVLLRNQMAGTNRRALPDPRYGVFSAKAGSPLQTSPCLQTARPGVRSSSYLNPSSNRKVTFNLPGRHAGGSALARSRNSLYRSASDGTLDTEFQPELQKLRTPRHLPEQPLNKHPLSPTLPITKLRLQRQLTAERLQMPTNFHQQSYMLQDSYLSPATIHQGMLPHSLPSSPIKRLGMSRIGQRLPTSSTPASSNAEQALVRVRQRVPICKSSPPSALLANSHQVRSSTPVGRQVSKYADSPLTQLRNELKYFASERKREIASGGNESPVVGSSALGGGDRCTYIGPYPPAWHQQMSASESDLEALLDLYSHPPDPVLDRQPPPGVSNYQRVPQYVLGGERASLQELRPNRRASLGCVPGTRYGAYGNTYGGYMGGLGYGGRAPAWEWDGGYGYSTYGGMSQRRPLTRYGSCGRLDDPMYTSGAWSDMNCVYPTDPYAYGSMDPYSKYMHSGYPANDMINQRAWNNMPQKNSVTLLPVRPYRL